LICYVSCSFLRLLNKGPRKKNMVIRVRQTLDFRLRWNDGLVRKQGTCTVCRQCVAATQVLL